MQENHSVTFNSTQQSLSVSRIDQAKFYLKAGAILLATTTVYAVTRAIRLLPQWQNDTTQPTLSHAVDTNVETTAVLTDSSQIKTTAIKKTLKNTEVVTDQIVRSELHDGLIDFQEVQLGVLEQEDAHKKEINPIVEISTHKRKLLQTAATPVVVANPIPDQIIQIGETYTYDLSGVFYGDYLRIQAVGLPSWLTLEYKTLGFYPADDGGEVIDIAVFGNTAFLADSNAGLQILNVSTLTKPQLLSTVLYSNNMNDGVNGVAVSGNIVFVAYGNLGLQILDVSNLTQPKLLSTYVTNGTVDSVAVSGNTVFVADSNAGLKILDVSNLTQPKLLGTYVINGTVDSIAISGNTVFVTDGNVGLKILDVSDPIHPRLLSTYRGGISGYAYGVSVSGNTVFMADWTEGLHIVNMSNPANPKLLSIYPAGSGYAYGVAVSGNTVFLADDIAGLKILDISNPINPQLVGTYRAGSSRALNVAVSANTVFVANSYLGLQIPNFQSAILVGIPLAAEVVTGQQWTVTIIAQGLDQAVITNTFKLTVDNLPKLVINTLTDQSIFPGKSLILRVQSEQLFSVSDPSVLCFSLSQISNGVLPAWLSLSTAPTLLSIYQADGGQAQKVESFGNTVFLANGGLGLQILDVKSLTHPKWLSTYPTNGGYTYDVAVSGNTAFVANEVNLQILDVSNLTSPQLLSIYPTNIGGVACDVAVSGNTVFVANGNLGLQILDVGNLTNPKLLSIYPASIRGATVGVVVLENLVFLAEGVGLKILNVSNPSDPQLLSIYLRESSTAYAYNLAIWENTVFMADGDVLQILDVSDPTDPRALSTYPASGGFAASVAVSGNKVFVADGTLGLQILDVSNLTNPKLISTYRIGTNGVAYGVSVSENTVFLAVDTAGLQILSLAWQLEISANPSTADEGNYYLALTAADNVGAFISIPFTIRVEGPPRIHKPIPPQYIKIGQSFYLASAGIFTDPNFDPLVFTLAPINSITLPAWLSFDPVTVTFSGIPTVSDIGLLTLQLTAADLLGGIARTDFNLTVVYAPVVNTPITQAVNLVTGRSFSFSIPTGTFYSYGQALTYVLKSADGTGFIPPWIQFNSNNGTVFGTPSNIGVVTLFIIAEDVTHNQASTPLILIISANAPPQVMQPISTQTAQVGQQFNFFVPANTFADPNGDPLTYSASLLGGSAFPGWLSFDSKTVSFKGTPGGTDTDAFSARIHTIVLVASDSEKAKAETLFNLNVGGTSSVASALKVGAPIISVLGALFGLYKNRAHIINRVRYPKYQKPNQEIRVGEPFILQLSTPRHLVGSVKAKTVHVLPPKGCSRYTDCQRFFKKPIHYLQLPFDKLPGGESLPRWMEYDEDSNLLYSKGPVPNTHYRELNIRVKDKNGVVTEQFNLRIEGATLTALPEAGERKSLPTLPTSARLQKEQGQNAVEMPELRDTTEEPASPAACV